jgi:hypothetical protein
VAWVRKVEWFIPSFHLVFESFWDLIRVFVRHIVEGGQMSREREREREREVLDFGERVGCR